MEEQLFVYGTLTKPEIQKQVIGREIRGEKDVLRGYKKTKVMIGGEVYTIIVRDEKSSVYGEVLSLDIDELEKVDDYETDVYRRIKVWLGSGKSADVYVKS